MFEHKKRKENKTEKISKFQYHQINLTKLRKQTWNEKRPLYDKFLNDE